MAKITLQEIWKAVKGLQQQREGNNKEQSENKQLIKKQRNIQATPEAQFQKNK